MMLDGCQDPAVGYTYWEVYAGTPSGFDPALSAYALPPLEVDGFYRYSYLTSYSGQDCGGSTPDSLWSYVVTDVDADRWPDFLQLADACVNPRLGVDQWLLHAGGPGGVSAKPSTLTLPRVGIEGGWPYGWIPTNGFYYSGDCVDEADAGEGAFDFSLTDLDGDGTPELLVTLDSCRDAAIGATTWEAYAYTPP